MKTVLITAYAVNPFKGSEDGTGWNIAREIAKHHKVILITRQNNVPHIQQYFAQTNDWVEQNMTVLGFDLPRPFPSLKKKMGERGYVLYFYFWQRCLVRFVRKQHLQFDLTHSLNFHSDNIPHFLWKLGKPAFWGPVGHHPKTPRAYLLPLFGFKELLRDRTYQAFKQALRNLDPNYRKAVAKTTHIFAVNASVPAAMRADTERTTVLPAVGCPKQVNVTAKGSMFTVLSVGRMHYMKGFDITIRAFANFYRQLDDEMREQVKLVLVGKGSAYHRLYALAKSEGINHKIEWVNEASRAAMNHLYREASVFFFPSHEGAGMVVPEALSHGVPVLCFDNVGPGALAGNAGIRIPYSNYADSIGQFTTQLQRLFQNPNLLSQLGSKAITRHRFQFTWESKARVILKQYEKALLEQKEPTSTIAVFHPSAELYGADRILVNALKSLPAHVNKRVYLRADGPLIPFLKSNVENVEVVFSPHLPVICRKRFHPLGILQFGRDWLRFARFFRAEQQKHHFRSAYVNTLACAFVLPLLHFFKLPNYIHVHEIIDRPKIVARCTAWLCRHFATKIVCVSNAVKESLQRGRQGHLKHAQVLHNGIPAIKNISPKKSEQKLHFFLFGRIMPEKGQWYLIEALKFIPRPLLSRCKFVVMGDAKQGKEDLLQQLKAAIQEAQLEQHVEIRPFENDISVAMSQADVCLVPSLMRDPFPTTVLEAMSAGKPVIATNHGGAREAIIDGTTGILVPPNDPLSLADKILAMALSTDRLRRLGRNAQRHYSKQFTLQHFGERWREFQMTNGFI